MAAEHEYDDADGLRDVARWLTTPVESGVYLSARDLQRIGDRAGLGRLPQNRRFAVEQLFRSAAIDERLPALFEALNDEVAAHMQSYRECGSAALLHWEDKARRTTIRLGQMRKASGV